MVRRAVGIRDKGVKWKLNVWRRLRGRAGIVKQAPVQVNISYRFLLHKVKQTGLEGR
jgi:hypothetical protein